MSTFSPVSPARSAPPPQALADSRRPARGEIAANVAIVLILIAGTFLRWGALGRESFWFDEGFTAWAASLSPGEILKVIHADVSPPGYYLLLHYWAKLFGQSETALRAMSAFFATLSMGVFWLLARRVLKTPLAVVVAMGLFALSVMQMEYAKDARFYTLVTFLSLVSIYALLRFLDLRASGKFSVGCMAAIVLSSALNIYSHNLIMLYVGMLSVLWLILPSREKPREEPHANQRSPDKRLDYDSIPIATRIKRGLKQRLGDLLLANGIIALLYLPWLPGLLGQMKRVRGDFWKSPPDGFEFYDELTLLAGVKNHYPTFLFYHLPKVNQYTAETVVGITLGIAALFLLWEIVRPRGKRTGELLALTLFAVAPVGVVWLLSVYGPRPMFIDRIFIASSPIFALIFAAPFARVTASGIALAGKACASLLVGVVALFMVLSVNGWWHEEHREDWRSVYQYVSALPRDGQLIVFCANEGEIVFDYYAKQRGNLFRPDEKLGLPEGFFELDPPRTSRKVAADSDIDRLRQAVESGRYKRIVYVKAHDWFSDPGNRVGGYLDNHFDLVKEQMFTEGVYVYEYAASRR